MAFDAQLYGSGRVGMMAQAQLDDTQTCAENLIGTGPFKLVDWRPNQSLTAEKNPDYWATDAEGNQLPYLDEIEFRPIVEVAQRLNALQSGEINAMHTSDAETIDQIRGLAESGEVNAFESDEFGEVATSCSTSRSRRSTTSRPARRWPTRPTSTRSTRSSTPASPPRPPDRSPGNIGNLDDTGFPTYDLARPRSLVEEYEAETGQRLSFTYTTTQAEATVAQAQLLKEQAEQSA